MNGVTRRTFTVRRDSPVQPSEVLASGILTVEEAMAQTRVYVVNAIDEYLHERALLIAAKDHTLVIEPMSTGSGLRLIDTCTSRPCPWMGDSPDYNGPTFGRRELFSIWYHSEER